MFEIMMVMMMMMTTKRKRSQPTSRETWKNFEYQVNIKKQVVSIIEYRRDVDENSGRDSKHLMFKMDNLTIQQDSFFEFYKITGVPKQARERE